MLDHKPIKKMCTYYVLQKLVFLNVVCLINLINYNYENNMTTIAIKYLVVAFNRKDFSYF